MYERMIVAFDGSEPSRRALKHGLELAGRLGKPLYTISVLEYAPTFAMQAPYAPVEGGLILENSERMLQELKSLTREVTAEAERACVPVFADSEVGEPVEKIVEAVHRHQADLLIIGLRHHQGLVERLFSHTGKDLAERSPCSVLGVR